MLHPLHAIPCAVAVYPTLHTHALTLVDPVPLVPVFDGQLLHALNPVVDEYVPLPHVVHTVAPADPEIDPAEQDPHPTDPVKLLYDPEEHCVHALPSPSAPLYPTLHTHAVAPVPPVYELALHALQLLDPVKLL